MKNILRVLTFIFIGLSAFFFVNYSNALDVPNAPNPPQNDNQVPTVPPVPTLFPGCETCAPTPTSIKSPTPTKPTEDRPIGEPKDDKPGNGDNKNNDGGQDGAQVIGLAPTSGEYTQAIGLIMFGSLMLLVAVKGYQKNK